MEVFRATRRCCVSRELRTRYFACLEGGKKRARNSSNCPAPKIIEIKALCFSYMRENGRGIEIADRHKFSRHCYPKLDCHSFACDVSRDDRVCPGPAQGHH